MARYIDAEALIKDIKSRFCEDCNNSDGMMCIICSTSDTLSELYGADTADVVEVKHGKWERKPIAGYADVICSACGFMFLENRGRWKYCPECGAKMDGGDT